MSSTRVELPPPKPSVEKITLTIQCAGEPCPLVLNFEANQAILRESDWAFVLGKMVHSVESLLR